MRKILLGLILVLWSLPAWAYTYTSAQIATPNRGIVQFLQGTDSAGTYKTLYTAATLGSRIEGIYITSNDATSHLITCQVVNGGVKYGGFAINTGTSLPGFANGVGAINAMSSANWPGLPIDAFGNPYLLMITGDTLQCTFATSLTSSDVINLYAVGGGDY